MLFPAFSTEQRQSLLEVSLTPPADLNTDLDRSEREAFYDAEIAPALVELRNRCTENGLSFLCIVEFNRTESDGSEYGRTVGFVPQSSGSIKWIDAFARADANFERYCSSFMRHCREHRVPHSSYYLERLGLAPNPDDRKE